MTITEPIDKAGSWHRMKREGRLEEFNARREELRAELKEKGMKRKDAATEAWRQAIDEYPPLPVEEDEEEAEEPDDPLADIEHRLPPPRPYNKSILPRPRRSFSGVQVALGLRAFCAEIDYGRRCSQPWSLGTAAMGAQ